MLFEQISNIYAILMSVIGLIMSMFRYVARPHRAWIYSIIFMLGNLLSNYYWGLYVFIMKDYPTISSFMAYLGWNISCLPLFFLLWDDFGEKKKKPFFSWLCLLPIPINIAQFVLYIPYGGIANNVWQGLWCTGIAVLSLHQILYYLHYRREGEKRPLLAYLMLLFVVLEYTMWTSSCFDWPSLWLHPYTYAVILCFAMGIFLPLTISRVLNKGGTPGAEWGRYARILKPLYLALIVIGCVGGYLLARWTKSILDGVVVTGEETDPYRIIAVILFVISGIIVVISVSIILVINYGKKVTESETLREEKLLAEHSNAAKSDFLANMSHEIRTPINAVLGMNEMILRESVRARDAVLPDRESIRGVFANICNYSGNIESAGQNLLSIINDILDFSKIEAGKLELVERNYELSSVLNDVTNMITFKAQDKGLDFQVVVEDSLPNGLFGDELRVRQVIINILNNAVKYTKKGKVVLNVAGEREKDLVYLVVNVKDTGIGIRKEDLGRLFTKFERMDLKQNSNVEGTGLGLAITQNLLNMMGGSIQVESEFGVGSSFTLRIPQRVVSMEPVGNFRERFEKSMENIKVYEESFCAPTARILVVDDTQMNLTVVLGLLKSTQLQMDTALSGAKAISMARDIPYDLILMDQRMPQMDGTEAMRHIREQEGGKNRQTPCICLTADAVSGARERYLAEGFEDYLTKPINSQALERMLIHYLPREKVILGPDKPRQEEGRGEGAVAEGFKGNPLYSSLRSAGIEPEKGLSRRRGWSTACRMRDSILISFGTMPRGPGEGFPCFRSIIRRGSGKIMGSRCTP